MISIIRLLLLFFLTLSGFQEWGLGLISSEIYGYDADTYSILESTSQTYHYDIRQKHSGNVGIQGTSTTDENRQVGVFIASLGDSLATKGIPGIDKPFRAANSAHPPNASLVEQMNNMKICSGTDCSEIAEKLFNASGGNGKVLRVTGANGSDLNLLEYGKVGGGFKYHEVFTDGKYVYDPRLSSSPVPKGDWQQMINGLNPGATIK